MVLEKKVDALIESRGVDVEQLLDLATGTAQSRTGSPGRAVSNGASPRRRFMRAAPGISALRQGPPNLGELQTNVG